MTIQQINAALEQATDREKLAFLSFLMGWLELAEGRGLIHANTREGAERGLKVSLRRFPAPPANWQPWQLANDPGTYGPTAGQWILVDESGENELPGLFATYDHAQQAAADQANAGRPS